MSALEDLLPLSPLQQGLLFHHELGEDREPDVYNVQLVLTLAGPLDPAAMHTALCGLLRRHANLRAGFRHSRSGRAVQLIPRDVTLPWRQVDATDHPDPPARCAEVAADELAHRFDLTRPPALRAVLVRLGATEHQLVITGHHILLDGWSTPVLVRELLALYEQAVTGGSAPALPPVTPYQRYLAWLVALDRDGDAPQAAWEAALAGLDGPTRAFPPAGIAEAGADGAPPDAVIVELGESETAAVTAAARRHGVTLGTLVQLAWGLVLARLTGRTDVVFGTTVAIRPPEIPGVENMIGLMANTVPVRVRVRPAEPVAEALRRLQAEQAALLDARHVGLAEIQRRAGMGELFDTLLVVENQPRPVVGLTAAGVRLTAVTSRDATHYPLSIVVTPGERLRYALHHRPSRVPREEVERVARWLTQQVTAIADTTGDTPCGALPMTSDDDRAHVDELGVPPPVTVPAQSWPALFAAQLARTPDAPAVRDGEVQLSYTELNERAARLAHVLIARGVGPKTGVGLLLERSVEAVVAFVAVQQAGGMGILLDPAHPPGRIARLLADAGPALIVTTTERVADLPEGLPLVLLDDPVTRAELAAAPTEPPHLDPDDPQRAAYLVYTSGSTGAPKGVVVTHTGIPDLVATAVDRLGVGPGSRIGQFAAWGFDVTVWELTMALLTGGCCVIVPSETRTDPDALVAFARSEDLSVLAIPPSLLAVIPTDPGFPPNTTLLVGSEPVPAELVTRWATRNRFVVAYGVTEATVNATLWVAPPGWTGRTVPIGCPDPGTRVRVLDAGLRPVPVGVPGELYLGGAGVARGYLGRPDLTAERFVPDPETGERLYRTGDLVRWSPDTPGVLEFLGRVDDQVQIRGFRVEPGEVESALLRHPTVAAAAVVPRPAESGMRLVAYVVPAPGTPADPRVWRRHLAAVLPDYLVPAAFVALDALPRTPNGKVDRAALPEPPPVELAGTRAPRTTVEELLAKLVADVLGLPSVGIDDDFFELGGDSITAIVLVSRARREGLGISARAVFTHRTVSALARVARPVVASPDSGSDDETGTVPITPIIAWLREHDGVIDGHNQSLLLAVPPAAGEERIAAVLQALLDRHAMLRARLRREPDTWELEVPPPGTVRAASCLRRVADPGTDSAVARERAAAMTRLDPDAGVMVQAVWFDAGSTRPGRLLLVVHHLVVDGVSWRILVPDLVAAWEAVTAGCPPQLDPVGTSFRRWARLLTEEAHRPGREAELPLWRAILEPDDPPLATVQLDRVRDTAATTRHLTATLSPERTAPLLTDVPAAFHAGVNDVLLTALALAVARWRERRGRAEPGRHDVLINLEGHGREEIVSEPVDLSRTVGWFTSTFPVRLDPGPVDLDEALRGGPDAGAALKRIKEQLRALPDKGVGFGLLRYLNARTRAELAPLRTPQIGFNYLGRFPTADPGGVEEAPVPLHQALTGAADPAMPAAYVLEINAIVRDRANGPELSVTWSWPAAVLPEPDVRELADLWFRALDALTTHIQDPRAGGHTPSDLLIPLDQDEIDELEAGF